MVSQSSICSVIRPRDFLNKSLRMSGKQANAQPGSQPAPAAPCPPASKTEPCADD